MGYIVNDYNGSIQFRKEPNLKPKKDKAKRKRIMRIIKNSRKINASRRKKHAK